MMNSKSNGKRIPLGQKPSDKANAWRALSTQAKLELMGLRQSGNAEMGGTPGQAPYWAAQEYGEPLAHIDALHYIQNSLDAFNKQAPGILARWLRG